MNTYYRVKIKLTDIANATAEFLVHAENEKEAKKLVLEYFGSDNSINYVSIKKSAICCVLGESNASMLYIAKVIFIGSSMNNPKQRIIAVRATDFKNAINLIEHAFDNLSTIKYLLLSDRQINEIEYWKEMEYIDYEIIVLKRSEMDYITTD